MREGGAENALDLTSKLSDGSMNPVQTAEKLSPASMSAKGQGKKERACIFCRQTLLSYSRDICAPSYQQWDG